MEKTDRDALLAQIAAHPGWTVLKEVMQQNARFQPVNFDEPAWQGRLQHHQAQSEFMIQVIRTVEKAAEACAPKQVMTHE